jgi:hypothetical protein
MEEMPYGQFEANAMYFATGMLAYNLAQLLKLQVLPPAYRTATVATLRWKLYRLAGKLVRHARRWVLQIMADLETWRCLQSARVRCAPARRKRTRQTSKGAGRTARRCARWAERKYRENPWTPEF